MVEIGSILDCNGKDLSNLSLERQAIVLYILKEEDGEKYGGTHPGKYSYDEDGIRIYSPGLQNGVDLLSCQF